MSLDKLIFKNKKFADLRRDLRQSKEEREANFNSYL